MCWVSMAFQCSVIRPAAASGSLDCDLGLSPVTNLMPVLRHGLLSGGDAFQLTAAWVSVPDLGVHADGQRYDFVMISA